MKKTHFDLRRSHFKLKIGMCVLAILLAAGGYGGFKYYQNSANGQPAIFHQKRRPDYVDYAANNRKIGRSALIKNARPPKMKLAKSVVAMDADTGQIVYQRNPNQPRKIASISKLMTLYLVERKASRTHGWNQTVKAADSPQLRKMGDDKNIGSFKFKRGHRYTVKELFQAALIQSSNNSAIALGEWVAGNNRNFVKMMNQQAKAWRINAHFVSVSGLENDDLKKYGLRISGNSHAGNQVSAKAVAVIAQHLLKQYPNVLNTSRQVSAKVDGQQLNNLDRLLPGSVFAKRNLKVDGLKTGFTPGAGECFVGTEKPKRKHRLITVILHDDNEFTDTRSLMNFVNGHSRA